MQYTSSSKLEFLLRTGRFATISKLTRTNRVILTIICIILSVVLRTDLPARLACLLEPFGVSHNACEDIQPAGSDMLITGCGPIGLFAIPIAKQMGATRGKIRSSTRWKTPYNFILRTRNVILCC